MGFDIFTMKKDPNSPRFSSCYTSCSELAEVCREVDILFREPKMMIKNSELGRFNYNDPRLQEIKKGLEAYVGNNYTPINKWQGVVMDLEQPTPEEILKGMAFSIKKVLEYAMKNRVNLLVSG